MRQQLETIAAAATTRMTGRKRAAEVTPEVLLHQQQQHAALLHQQLQVQQLAALQMQQQQQQHAAQAARYQQMQEHIQLQMQQQIQQLAHLHQSPGLSASAAFPMFASPMHAHAPLTGFGADSARQSRALSGHVGALTVHGSCCRQR